MLHRVFPSFTGFLVFFALVGLTACGTEEPTILLAGAIEQDSAAISGGYNDNEDTAVVGIVSLANNSLGICSGTLIAPNVVLTAQHCVAPTSSEGVLCGATTFGQSYDPSGLFISTKRRLTQSPDDYYSTAEILVPPGGSDFCGYDIALMILNNPVDPAEATPRIAAVDVDLEQSDGYYAVGYGATDGAGSGSGQRRRRDGLYVACVADECPPAYTTYQEMIGDTGVCQGDSGGPAFDLEHRVVGIASRGSAGCEMPIYTYVRAWGDWIKDKVIYGTTGAGVDTPKWAYGAPTDPIYTLRVGAECTTDSDCESNMCRDGYCTRPCEDLAPCPDSFMCENVTNECVSIYDLRVGAACESNADCLSNMCHNNYCTRPCNEGAVCPDYYQCQELGGYCISDREAEEEESADSGCHAVGGSFWTAMLGCLWLVGLYGRRKSYAESLR
ncbi:MAG: S1 family peptidase [Deltaproteobacteria bacterium]|jgi:hypothetical protein|nr:S1 family peptidase [Deltaproteobacteria bacterium]